MYFLNEHDKSPTSAMYYNYYTMVTMVTVTLGMYVTLFLTYQTINTDKDFSYLLLRYNFQDASK